MVKIWVLFLFYPLVALASLPLQRQTLLSSWSPPTNGIVKVAFFDADSTLRISKSGSPSANGVHDYWILPGVAHQIQRLNQDGFLVAIVSNQAGIPQYVSLEDADQALFNLIQDLRIQGAFVDYFDFAENKDRFRKPQTGMKERLENVLQQTFGNHVRIDSTHSLMVGDSAYKKASGSSPADVRPDGRAGFNFSNSDRIFAKNLGIDFHEPQYFFGWSKYGVEIIETVSDLNALLTKMNAPSVTTCSAQLGKP